MHGEVIEVVRLAPRLVRVVLGGDGLEEFRSTPFTDQYVNALFEPDGDSGRQVGRRYTIRRWDPAERRVSIDFVVHGDVGVAGRWANHAQPGDRLEMVGPHGAYAPSTTAAWHLLVGDESALPAIAATLERLRPGVRAEVVVVVDGPEHELALDSPADVRLRWVHRCDGGSLLAAVEDLTFPPGAVDVFVHGEASEVRAVRRHLVAERGVPKEGTSISPYWRRSYTDEAWREIKKTWLAEMALDT